MKYQVKKYLTFHDFISSSISVTYFEGRGSCLTVLSRSCYNPERRSRGNSNLILITNIHCFIPSLTSSLLRFRFLNSKVGEVCSCCEAEWGPRGSSNLIQITVIRDFYSDSFLPNRSKAETYKKEEVRHFCYIGTFVMVNEIQVGSVPPRTDNMYSVFIF